MIKPIIGITMGDPASIGPEITIKAMVRPEVYDWCRPLVVGDAARDGKSGEIVYLDPESGLAVYTAPCGDVFSKDFASRWIERTLAEVRG